MRPSLITGSGDIQTSVCVPATIPLQYCNGTLYGFTIDTPLRSTSVARVEHGVNANREHHGCFLPCGVLSN